MKFLPSILCSAVAAAGVLAARTVSLSAEQPERGQATLVARSVLPAATLRAGSPPSGAFFSAAERATALANGVRRPSAGPYLAGQPVQGFSSMVPAGAGTWWALAAEPVPEHFGPGARGAADAGGPLAADDTEMILVRLGTPLAVDRRLLPVAGR